DDPQDDESAASPYQTAKRLNTIMGTVLGLAGPGQSMAAMAAVTVIERGDLADQLLDHGKHPEWRGERTSLLHSMPTDETLWAEYTELRRDSIRQGGMGEQANEFYRDNLEAMNAGAVAGWEARFDAK